MWSQDRCYIPRKLKNSRAIQELFHERFKAMLKRKAATTVDFRKFDKLKSALSTLGFRAQGKGK